MSKIPTADEFFNKWGDDRGYVAIDQYEDIDQCMIEFAKLHVEEALKVAANNNLFSYHSARGRVYEDVYPLKNIK